jgi:superfamily II DNA or RNA helicase
MTISQVTAYQLRDYQINLIQRVFSSWFNGNRHLMLQLPTGGGKTIIFTAIAHEFIVKAQSILVIAHREELIVQAAEKLEAVTNMPVGIIKAGYKQDESCLIQVASIQTLIRRQLPPAELVIFDEAHHCHSRTYAKVFQHYAERDSYILGCTATPIRTDGRGLRYLYSGTKGFEQLIIGSTVKELIDRKYLAPFRLYSPAQIIEASTASIKTTGGDYNQKQLADFVEKKLIIGDVIETWKKHAAGKRTVLFAVSVKHSLELARAFRSQGIAAAHLDGDTKPESRKKILARFAAGKIEVLCQHSIVTEGIDIPLIEAIQFARPTKSLTVWFQAIGRALRPAPGKANAIIIDHTDTHLNLPWPDDNIDWSLDPQSLQSSNWAISCPECRHIFRPIKEERSRCLATCPACNVKFTFEAKKTKKGFVRLQVVQVLPANFSEFSQEFDSEKIEIVKQIILEQQERGYQKGWVVYQLLDLPELNLSLGDWREIARLLGYRAGWAWYKLNEMQTRCLSAKK